MTPSATFDVEVGLSAVITHEPREEDQIAVTAAFWAKIGEGEPQQVGRADGVGDFEQAAAIDTELRQHCAALGIEVSRKCRIEDAPAVVAGLQEFEVLVPDALTSAPGEPPEYGPVWMGAEGIELDNGRVVFVLAGDPTLRWSTNAEEVELRASC